MKIFHKYSVDIKRYSINLTPGVEPVTFDNNY